MKEIPGIAVFMIWIEGDINPKRISMGLNPINEEEARKCYDILIAFNEHFTLQGEIERLQNKRK